MEAGRTEKMLKTTAIEPEGNSSSNQDLPSSSSSSVASVIAAPVLSGLAPLAILTSTGSESGVGSVSLPSGEAGVGGSGPLPKIIASPAGPLGAGQVVHPQEDMATVRIKYWNTDDQKVTKTIRYVKSDGLKINIRELSEDESDESDESIEGKGTHKGDGFDSKNDADREGRGDGDGAGLLA